MTTPVNFDHVDAPPPPPPPPPTPTPAINATHLTGGTSRTSSPALGTASILLAGIIGVPPAHPRPCNLPRDEAHAKQAAAWALELLEICGDDPEKSEAAARTLVGYLNNPLAAHCSKDEVFSLAIEAVKRLHQLTK